MARISFSALVEEIVGKLAGSVFQDSYGGFQVRTRVSPKNPQTQYQQLRRGEFGYLSAGWRFLTDPQRQTFIDAASTPPAALNLYLQSNINLTLIEEPTITTYVTSTTPETMQIDLLSANNGAVIIQASGAVTTVPAGLKLLVQLTPRKEETKIFTNPSQYSPVISYDEGTDLTVIQNIISEWQARYGQMQSTGRIALKASLVDKSNGNRGTESFSAVVIETSPMQAYFDSPPSGGGFNCPGGTPRNVYNDGTIGVGHAWYYDSGLLVPVTGFSRYTNDVPASAVFNCNPATGVGTAFAGLCV